MADTPLKNYYIYLTVLVNLFTTDSNALPAAQLAAAHIAAFKTLNVYSFIEVSEVNYSVNLYVQKRHWILAYVARNE